jgi:Tol biopolymer transport system component
MIKRTALPSRGWLLLTLPLALLLSACLPEGIKVPQSEFSSLIERKSGLIALLAVDGNIYTVDQGGNGLTPITEDAFQDESGYRFYGLPIWSPDSQALAFAGYEGQPESEPSVMSLFTASRDGDGLTQAHKSGNFPVFYDWSPTGDQIGFISQTPNQSLALQTVPSAGGEARLVDAGAPYYWAWSPDGSAMLAHVGGGVSSQAHLSLLQFGTEAEVVEFGLEVEPATFKAPAFSPDGSQVLVASQTESGTNALVLMDVLGQNQQVLTEYNGSIAFAWSPNGQRVAYLVSPTDELGEPGILTVIDPSGRRRPVELKNETPYAFFWSPDSQSLAYFVDQPTEENAAEGEEQEQQSNFVWSLRIMDAGNGRTHTVQDSLMVTEQFLQVIPYFDQYHQALTIWSPDSKNLVVSAYRPDGTPSIFVVAASGRLEPRYIVNGLAAFWSPR